MPFPAEGHSRAELVDGVARLAVRTGKRVIGWSMQLVSAPINTEQLHALTEELKAAVQEADVVEIDAVLLPARPPARTSRTPLVFAAGQAPIAVRTDRDRSDLRVLSAFRAVPSRLDATVALDGDDIPPSPVRRRQDWSSPRYTTAARRLPLTATSCSSSGADRVGAPGCVCADHGVTASPSASGRTALALPRQLSSLEEVRWLAHRPLISLLCDKASFSGMSWWKKRANEIAHAAAVNAEDPDAALTAITDATAQGRSSVSHGGESAATITFGELCTVMGSPRQSHGWHGRRTGGLWSAGRL